MTKGIIFGAGYMGNRLAEELDYNLTKLNPLNLNELRDFLDSEKPPVVINAIGKAGRPNIDWCETHKEETTLSNVSAAITLGVECSKRNIYFVHFGSGCLYAGDNNGKGYTEEDPPNCPGKQFYQKTKYLTEQMLREFPGLILRIRFPIDNRPHERNLIDKLLSYPSVIDVPNSMVIVPHMIKAIEKLINMRAGGIYHMVNPGMISPFEILKMYQNTVAPSFCPKEMTLAELDRSTIGKRTNCMLNTHKLNSAGIYLPEIHEGVKECLLKYKEYLK
jgi:dTDP-4-dehydrorhamnose reductase